MLFAKFFFSFLCDFSTKKTPQTPRFSQEIRRLWRYRPRTERGPTAPPSGSVLRAFPVLEGRPGDPADSGKSPGSPGFETCKTVFLCKRIQFVLQKECISKFSKFGAKCYFTHKLLFPPAQDITQNAHFMSAICQDFQDHVHISVRAKM